MFPELAVLVKVPIVVGDAKEPLELESCAVYTLPLLNVPVDVKGTLKLDEPEVVVTQYGPYEAAVVDSDWKLRLTSSMAVAGRVLPPPVEDAATILIHTGPLLLFNAVPKLTVTVIEPHEALPPLMGDAGEVVTVVKEVGEEPKP